MRGIDLLIEVRTILRSGDAGFVTMNLARHCPLQERAAAIAAPRHCREPDEIKMCEEGKPFNAVNKLGQGDAERMEERRADDLKLAADATIGGAAAIVWVVGENRILRVVTRNVRGNQFGGQITEAVSLGQRVRIPAPMDRVGCEVFDPRRPNDAGKRYVAALPHPGALAP